MASRKDYVVITGSSTGIGFSTAEMLAKNGFMVLAAVRTQQDGEKLEGAHSNIKSFILDVARSEDMARAFEEIEPILKTAERVSLVNNAGISVPGPLEGLTLKDLRKQFDVNFFGLIEWTQYLLPYLRGSKGKLINISSVSGLVSSPFLGAYCASKYALEAASDALRRELIRFSVEVVLIEPGPIATPIWDKGISKKNEITGSFRSGTSSLYQQELSKMAQRAEKAVKDALPAETVAKEILLCMNRKSNPTRILVANPKVRLQIKLARLLPTKFMDKALTKIFYK